jgi:hypothetical protein
VPAMLLLLLPLLLLLLLLHVQLMQNSLPLTK